MMRGVNKLLDTANDNFYCSVANSVINICATKCHALLISRRLIIAALFYDVKNLVA